METLVEQPLREQTNSREQRSFEPLASVAMMQYDIQQFGRVLPETRQRVYDEELSYLSEGVDRAARTSFTLKREGDELVYFAGGTWQSYQGLLTAGMRVAEQEAAQDSRRDFLADRAVEDYRMGYLLQQLQPGQKLTWHSAYPAQEAAQYGDSFIQECGFRPERQMGFLYQAVCGEDGAVTLHSQTVDRSNTAAFSAVRHRVEIEPNVDLDDLTTDYDQALTTQLGGQFYAGRRGAEREENAWKEITQQHDLVQYLLDGIEKIAKLNIPNSALETKAKQHVYGVWAAFKQRLDSGETLHNGVRQQAAALQLGANRGLGIMIEQTQLVQEVFTAYNQFAASGKMLVGCGGAIRVDAAGQSMMSADSEDVFGSIFGSDSKEDKYGSLQFKCQKGHGNTRPYGKLIPRCTTCGISVAC